MKKMWQKVAKKDVQAHVMNLGLEANSSCPLTYAPNFSIGLLPLLVN